MLCVLSVLAPGGGSHESHNLLVTNASDCECGRAREMERDPNPWALQPCSAKLSMNALKQGFENNGTRSQTGKRKRSNRRIRPFDTFEMLARLRSLQLLLLLLLVQVHRANAEAAAASTLASDCSLSCATPFERCIVFDGVELCAAVCSPGRCDESAGETCVLRGVACAAAPCLPVAACELSGQQVSASMTAGMDDANALAACHQICPPVHSPVCASDGVSYVNECYFEHAKCLAEYRGAASTLTVVATTLCASDEALNLAHNPPASAIVEDATALAVAACHQATGVQCADLDEPVCTSSGTMRNVCYWRRVRRCQDSVLANAGTETATNSTLVELLRYGACEGDASTSSALDVTAECPAACPSESRTTSTASSSVCASNGMLFASDCEFRRARCARPLLVGGLTRQTSAASCTNIRPVETNTASSLQSTD
jgi:hypothetical protein